MKKLSIVLLAMLLVTSMAWAESPATVPPQLEGLDLVVPEPTEEDLLITVADILEIRPHKAVIMETLGAYGEASDDKNQFVCIDLDVCNVSFENVDLAYMLQAELSYQGRYSFSLYEKPAVTDVQRLLTGTWRGTYVKAPERRECILEIQSVAEDDTFEGVFTFNGYDTSDVPYGSYTVRGQFDSSYGTVTYKGVSWIERPGTWTMLEETYQTVLDGRFLSGISTGFPIYMEKEQNGSGSAELGVLEETTYHLCFLVPNRVAADLDNCKVTLNVYDGQYDLPLK